MGMASVIVPMVMISPALIGGKSPLSREHSRQVGECV
jgi:hypothetical protein